MEEIWKDITNYEGRYMISNHGRVKSMNYKGSTGKERILKPHRDTGGYCMVDLGSKKSQKVHRLVAAAFIGDITDLVINHKDFNRKNNHVSNLEIITLLQNFMHSYLDKNERGIYTSKFLGVHCYKGRNLWGASRRIKGKKYFINFKTEQEAYEATLLNDIDFLDFKANHKLKNQSKTV